MVYKMKNEGFPKAKMTSSNVFFKPNIFHLKSFRSYDSIYTCKKLKPEIIYLKMKLTD